MMYCRDFIARNPQVRGSAATMCNCIGRYYQMNPVDSNLCGAALMSYTLSTIH